MAEILCSSQQAFARKPAWRKRDCITSGEVSPQATRKRKQAMFPRVRANIRLCFAIFRPIRAGIFV
jgi:hypothetical protein